MFSKLNLTQTAPYIIYLPSKNILNLIYKNKFKGVITYSKCQPFPILIINT